MLLDIMPTRKRFNTLVLRTENYHRSVVLLPLLCIGDGCRVDNGEGPILVASTQSRVRPRVVEQENLNFLRRAKIKNKDTILCLPFNFILGICRSSGNSYVPTAFYNTSNAGILQACFEFCLLLSE